MINMRDAYLKVLGLDQKPLEEKKKMARPSWVPESVTDEDVSDFMGAVAQAHKADKDTFKFGDKSYKVTIGSNAAKNIHKNMEEGIEIDDTGSDMKKTSGSDDEDDDDENLCEVCGKVHEGKCAKSPVEQKEEMDEQALVAPVPGDKWKDQAVMVNTKNIRNGKPQRVVIDRKNTENYPAKDGWKEVSPGTKVTAKGAKSPVEQKEDKELSLEDILSEEEIASILAKLKEEKDRKVQANADKEDMGENLSDGELDFLDQHEIEVIDATPEDPNHDEDVDQATPPKAQGAAKVDVDGQKIAATKPEVAVKSQAKVGK